MVTSNMVLADFAEKLGSLRAYLPPEILSWINNSEPLKGQLRNYLNDPTTARVIVFGGEQSSAAAYQFPTLTESGFATFGIDRLTGTANFIETVSHEFGHEGVENSEWKSWAGPCRHYQVLGAQARSEQDLAAWQDIEQKVAMQVAQAHGEAMAAWESLAASQTLLSVATQANESAERRYAKGAADILELLTSQAARSDAALESIRGLSQWHAARLQLLASAGRIGTFQ